MVNNELAGRVPDASLSERMVSFEEWEVRADKAPTKLKLVADVLRLVERSSISLPFTNRLLSGPFRFNDTVSVKKALVGN